MTSVGPAWRRKVSLIRVISSASTRQKPISNLWTGMSSFSSSRRIWRSRGKLIARVRWRLRRLKVERDLSRNGFFIGSVCRNCRGCNSQASFLCCFASMLFVSRDDALNQWVADDVPLAELHHADAFDFFESVLGLDQS